MKTALKWIGWAILAVIVAAAFFDADKTTQWVLFLGGGALYLINSILTQAKESEQKVLAAIYRLERKVDELAAEPIYFRHFQNDLADFIAEQTHRRTRDEEADSMADAAARAAHNSGIGVDWPFKR